MVALEGPVGRDEQESIFDEGWEPPAEPERGSDGPHARRTQATTARRMDHVGGNSVPAAVRVAVSSSRSRSDGPPLATASSFAGASMTSGRGTTEAPAAEIVSVNAAARTVWTGATVAASGLNPGRAAGSGHATTWPRRPPAEQGGSRLRAAKLGAARECRQAPRAAQRCGISRRAGRGTRRPRCRRTGRSGAPRGRRVGRVSRGRGRAV